MVPTVPIYCIILTVPTVHVPIQYPQYLWYPQHLCTVSTVYVPTYVVLMYNTYSTFIYIRIYVYVVPNCKVPTVPIVLTVPTVPSTVPTAPTVPTIPQCLLKYPQYIAIHAQYLQNPQYLYSTHAQYL